jgi:hypothetical protein
MKKREIQTMSKITKGKILERLSPMYNVTMELAKDGRVFIVKDDVKFGFIKDRNLYLMNEFGDFVQVVDDMNNPDQLLIEATKSFWHARAHQDEEA